MKKIIFIIMMLIMSVSVYAEGEITEKAARKERDRENRRVNITYKERTYEDVPMRSVIGMGVCLLILFLIAVKNTVSSILGYRK